MKHRLHRILCALLSAMLLLPLAGCTPPPDVSVGFDENGEKPPHIDTSPLAADRHKDPDAPQKVEYQREKMLQYQGYYYFLQEGNVAPSTIDDILIELGTIPSTLPRYDCPVENLQTNFGFVGYTVWRNEDHPQYLYIMDNGTFRVLYSPQREEKGYDMPSYLRCQSITFQVFLDRRLPSLPENFSAYTELGEIHTQVSADEYPYEELSANCDVLGGKVYLSANTWEGGYIELEDGYVPFGIPTAVISSIRYKGALFCGTGEQATNKISTSYEKVGAVLGIVPGNLHASADFYCNFGAIGCEVYASKFDAGTIYVLYAGMYHPYTLPGTYS